MNSAAKLTLIATLAAVCGVQSCASLPGAAPLRTDIGPFVFLRKAGGWALSSAQPSFPYNAEPRLQAMFGASGARPFGCGLTSVRSGYFSGVRGELVCVTRAVDGRLQLKGIERGADFARVYDAAPLQDGFVLVAKPFGRSAARVILLDADGRALSTSDLPGDAPDQAVILPTGRIALLRDEGGACNWTVLEHTAAGFQPIVAAPADRPLCHLSNLNGEALRDQVSGQVYLRSRYPAPNALYRIDDNARSGPASLIADDFAAGVDPGSSTDADYVTIHDGTIYFATPTVAGPVIGQYDLETRKTMRTDFRASSGRWQDAERVYGFMIAPATSPQVAVMNGAGRTRMVALQP